jgi:hypothetical protein
VVLCFDGVPGNAPLTLRQTSPGDAWLVRQMTGLQLSLFAGSWTNRAERGEIDCDCSIFDAAGFTTVEIENEHTGTRYHTNRDTAEAISPNLVQSYGKTMLALADQFGSIDLRTQAADSDLIYFSLPVVGMAAYPGWVMAALSGLGFLALLTFVVVAWRQGVFLPGRFGLSLVSFLLGIGLVVLLAQLAWGLIMKGHAAEVIAHGGLDTKAAWIAGIMTAGGFLLMALLALLARRLGEINLAVAAEVVFLIAVYIFYFGLGGDDPLVTPYIAWPFVGSVAGLGVLLFTKSLVWKTVLLSFSAMIMMVLLVPYLILGTYTPEDVWIPMIVLGVLVGLFTPQLGFIFGKSVPKKGSQSWS